MKKQLLFAFLLFNFGVFAQLADTTCIRSRWIEVKKNTHNAPLFAFDEEQPESSLIGVVKGMLEQNRISSFSSRDPNPFLRNWYLLDDIDLYMFRYKDDPSYTERPDFITISMQSDIPLTDEYGDAKIVVVDGMEMYEYPPVETYAFTANDIVELHIRETKSFNGKFIVDGIGFCHKNELGVITELFWVDVRNMYHLLKEEKPVWFDFLFDKQFKGFQFHQKSCYD